MPHREDLHMREVSIDKGRGFLQEQIIDFRTLGLLFRGPLGMPLRRKQSLPMPSFKEGYRGLEPTVTLRVKNDSDLPHLKAWNWATAIEPHYLWCVQSNSNKIVLHVNAYSTSGTFATITIN